MKRVAVLAVFVAAVGCESTVENSLGSPVGNFPLVAVDGLAVPANTGTSITVRGALSLKSGGAYTISQADSSASGAVSNSASTGKWSLSDNALALIDDSGPLELGIVVSFDTVRLSHRNHQNVYVRR